MEEFKTIKITIEVYIPKDLTDVDSIEEYLNDKLHCDPDFYGYIDQGCFEIID